MKGNLLVLALFLFLLFVFPTSIQAKQGCCSWHNGVDYCDTSVGRYVCNDGTYSPTCTCTYIPPQTQVAEPIATIAPTPIPTPEPTPRPTTTPSPTPTPTPVPTTTSPEVKSVSAESTVIPSPIPQAAAGSVVGGLTTGGIILGLGFLGVKWLAKVTAPKEPLA